MRIVRAGLNRVAHAQRRNKRAMLLLVDALAALLSLFVATALLLGSPFQALTGPAFWALAPAAAGSAALASSLLGLQHVKLKSLESVAILKTALMATIATLVVLIYLRLTATALSAAGVILFGLMLFLSAVAIRLVMLNVLRWTLRQGRAPERVLIYGAGKTGMELAAALRSSDDIQAVAFADDNISLHGMTVAGLKVHPSADIALLVRNHRVRRVILAMPSVSPPKLAQIGRRVKAFGVEVQTVPSFAQLIGTEELMSAISPVEPRRLLSRSHMADALPHGRDLYHGRNIFVSGAGGSIGAELCRQIAAYQPARLVLFEVSESALYQIHRELEGMEAARGIEIVPVLGSVADSRLCRSTLMAHKIGIVFHAAAYKHVPLVEGNPLAGLANNVLGTRTLADAALAANVQRFVLVSTDKAVRPTNVMGASKRLAELVIQDLARRSSGTVFSMVRFGNVLGSSGSVVPLFADQIARGGPVTLTHEDVTRFFMTISEAASLVLVAGSFAAGDKGGDVYVLDMGKPVRIRDLAERMIHDAGYTVRDAKNPDGDIEIAVTGLRPGEKLHEELLIGEGLLTTPHPKILRAREASLSEVEIAKALARLGVAIGQGDSAAALAVLRDTVEGYGPAAASGRRHA
jgi:FlaA1/EpsC-like NDP-sugar epimerase